MFDVAKSIFAACDRATLVTTDVGSRFASPARPDSAPEPFTPDRFSAIDSLITLNLCTGSIGPAGVLNRVGVNELPPIDVSARVLTTKLVFKVWRATPRASW